MPPTKNTFSCKLTPPADGCNWTFSQIRSHMGKYSVFCSYTNKILEICLFSNDIRANLDKYMSCPFSPKQPNNHECTPPSQKALFLGIFRHAHPKLSKCHQNISKLRVIFTKSPNQESSKSAISNKSEHAQNNISPISTWQRYCPPILWKPYFYSTKMRWTTY